MCSLSNIILHVPTGYTPFTEDVSMDDYKKQSDRWSESVKEPAYRRAARSRLKRIDQPVFDECRADYSFGLNMYRYAWYDDYEPEFIPAKAECYDDVCEPRGDDCIRCAENHKIWEHLATNWEVDEEGYWVEKSA